MKKLVMMSVIAALAVGVSLTAFAQSQPAKKEISTAHAHAMMAQQAKTVDMAHTHLHHVINCLVGPKGEQFDSSAADPCKGQGHGAIPDSKGNASMHGKLESALATAEAGLKADKLASVHKAAAKVAAALQDTSTQKSSGGYSW